MRRAKFSSREMLNFAEALRAEVKCLRMTFVLLRFSCTQISEIAEGLCAAAARTCAARGEGEFGAGRGAQ